MSAAGPAPTATYTGSPFPLTGTPGESRAAASPGLASPGRRRVPGGGESRAPRGPYAPAPPAPAVPHAAPQAPKAPKQAARDVADLLPPVSYAPPQSQRSQKQKPSPAWPPSAPDRQGQAWPLGTPEAPKPAVPGPRPQSRPNTMAGLALMVAAVALTVVLPVAGLLASLAVITLLRAADRAQSKLAVRRSVRGPQASDLLVVLVTAPLAVARALLTEVLMAPLAVIVGAAVYGLTVVFTHSMNMPRAGAYAAAAVVAWYGLGPGSGRPRRQLNRMAGAVARTPASAAAIAIAVWALAIAAVMFASSQTPYYWPAMTLHIPGHLPGLHSLITSASHWLLRNVHA